MKWELFILIPFAVTGLAHGVIALIRGVSRSRVWLSEWRLNRATRAYMNAVRKGWE